jgi:hypothetical protein
MADDPPTLATVAALAAADETHRYELGPDGTVSSSPAGDPDHALAVTRLLFLLAAHGFTPEQIVANCPINVAGCGFIPDLTVWETGRPPETGPSGFAGTAGLLLVAEVTGPGTATVDRTVKPAQYATAGIGRYWLTGPDGTVHRHVLTLGGYAPDPGGNLQLPAGPGR